MFSLFNGLPHPSRRSAEPLESGRPPSGPSPFPDESPAFLHAGFAPFEPGLTGEIRQALGEQAARRTGDVA
jgi:hypothetical protein